MTLRASELSGAAQAGALTPARPRAYLAPRLAARGQHFFLPEGNVQIAFSGGRTSGMMLHCILEANGGLPERAHVTFQNTGREMPETLDFVQECGERWGVPIVWLEYRSEAPRFEIVSHNSASRDGEPFEALIRKRRLLPNQVARFCTAELKVHCSTRYARSLGWSKYTRALGMRADEPQRISDGPNRERWNPWYPLAAAGISKRDVSAFWRRQPFDLRLENVNGKTPLGNCDGCFLKSEANLAALAREHPERAAWWAEQEQKLAELIGKGSGAAFNSRRSYAEIIDMVQRQGDWIFDTEGFLCQADDGECVG